MELLTYHPPCFLSRIYLRFVPCNPLILKCKDFIINNNGHSGDSG